MKRTIILFALLTLLAIGAKAQIVGANEGKKTSASTTLPLYKPTGHYLRLEAGYPHFASVAYGYQLNPYIMLGGGFGYGEISYTYTGFGGIIGNLHDYVIRGSGAGIPIFAEANFSTPKYKWSFVANIKFGYAIPLENGYYSIETASIMNYYDKNGHCLFGAINLGVTYKNLGLFTGASSNSEYWWSILLSYNLPLKIHK